MTEEDKKLLLADLCSRLPYRIIINVHDTFPYSTLPYFNMCLNSFVSTLSFIEPIFKTKDKLIKRILKEHTEYLEFKPYLRPMSSMTEEEKEELKSRCIHTETEEDWEGVRCDVWGIQILDKYNTKRWDNPIWPSTINMDAIDWLNAHHFDYRGLIEKGLALEVPDGMYEIQD